MWLLASDLDGTLVTDSKMTPGAMRALQRLRARSLRLVLVSGRSVQMLEGFEGLDLDVFDFVVAEDGATLYEVATCCETPLCEPVPDEVIDRLRSMRVTPLTSGRRVISMARKHEAAVSGLLHKGYPDLHLLLDKKSMSVLPRDVSKASGLRAALNKLAIPSSDVLGLGDAENDADLFEASGYRVAVADALPQIKALAQHVTRGSGEAALNELDELLQTLN